MWLWLYADIQHMCRPTQKALQIWNVCHSQSCAHVCLFMKYFYLFNNALSYESVCSTFNISLTEYHRFSSKTSISADSVWACIWDISLLWCHIRTCMCVFAYVTHWITLLAWSCIFSGGQILNGWLVFLRGWSKGNEREGELFRPLSSGSLEPGQ